MALLLITKNSGMYTMTGIYTGDMKAGNAGAFYRYIAVCSKEDS